MIWLHVCKTDAKDTVDSKSDLLGVDPGYFFFFGGWGGGGGGQNVVNRGNNFCVT